MRACVLHAVGDLRCEERATPAPGLGEVLLRVEACGVCGSDIPRIFSKGTYSFPLIPGHEFAGRVVEVGEDVDRALVGRVFAVFPLIPCGTCAQCANGLYALCENYDYLGSRRDGGFAEFVSAPVANLVAVPERLEPEEAALTEPAAVALHALRRGELRAGEAMAIYGAGPIGLLLGLWARHMNAERILFVDIDCGRIEFARQELDFKELFDATTGDPAAWVREISHGGADVVIEASGSSAAVGACMESARVRGRVVLMGNPAGEMRMSQRQYWAILRKELSIRGTWNSVADGADANEWTQTLDAMASRKLDVRHLISHRITLDELPRILEQIRDRKCFSNKVLVEP